METTKKTQRIAKVLAVVMFVFALSGGKIARPVVTPRPVAITHSGRKGS
jgi:hypothetical protein